MPNETAEITVQYVNYPKEGKKYGSIKSSEGDYFSAMPPMLRMFTTGEVCTIEFKTTPEGYKNLVKKIGTTKAPPLSPPPRQRTNPIDTENMFVTALLKSFIEAGKIELSTTDIVAAIQDIKKAYRFTSTEKQISDDLNDSVDY